MNYYIHKDDAKADVDFSLLVGDGDCVLEIYLFFNSIWRKWKYLTIYNNYVFTSMQIPEENESRKLELLKKFISLPIS